MKLVIDIPYTIKMFLDYGIMKNGSAAAILQCVKEGKEYKDRPKGEWIQSDKDKYWAMCSVCKKEAICGDFMILTDFCPNCGADMREGDSDA